MGLNLTAVADPIATKSDHAQLVTNLTTTADQTRH
jgi:hypothetical protein